MRLSGTWTLGHNASTLGRNLGALVVTCVSGLLVGAVVLLTVGTLGAPGSLAIYVLVLCSALLGVALLLRPTWVVAYFAWIAVQNLVLPWLNNLGFAGAEVLRAAIGFKEAIAAVLLAFALVQYFRTPGKGVGTSSRLLALYGVLLALALISPWPLGVPFGARLVGFRTLAMPLCFFLIGRFWPADLEATRKIVTSYIVLSVVLSLFGLFERFGLPVEFWGSVVGMGSYITDVKGIAPDYHVENGVVANMFRFGIRRLVSTFGDPLSCGNALVLPVTLVWAYLWGPTASKRMGTRVHLMTALAILGSALVLTINRGAILTVLVAVPLLLSRGTMVRYVLAIIVGLLLLTVWQPQVAQMVYDTVTLQEGSARAHFDHLVLGAPSLLGIQYVLGLGLGRSGFWAQELYGTTVPGIGENAFFMLVLQIGYLGAILFIGWVAAAAIELRRDPQPSEDAMEVCFRRAVSASLLAHLIVANTSENMFSFTGMSQAWFMSGLALRSRMQNWPAVGVVKK
jgi:hypothetical protein